MLYSVFKMECTVLLFLFKKQLFKELYVIHLIFKNGITNIFPSQTSFLLLSSNTHASFVNKPIKFCRRKPNTWWHVFAVVVYVLPSKFSYTTAFFCCRSFSKFRGLVFDIKEVSFKLIQKHISLTQFSFGENYKLFVGLSF